MLALLTLATPLPLPAIDFADPAGAIESARGLLCTNEMRSQLGSLDMLVQQALPGAKPISPALELGWNCLCSDFDATAPEITEAASAITSAISGDGDGEASVERLMTAVRALIPVVMGDRGLCSGACKGFVVALGDWAIGSVSWNTLAPDLSLSFLPPITELEGLPAAAMDCVCSGVSWVDFAKLLSTSDGARRILSLDLEQVSLPSLPSLPGSLEEVMEGASATFSSAFPASSVASALRAAFKYPIFFLGRDGFCSGECGKPFKLVARYIQRVALALLGRDASLARVSAAVQALSTDNLHTCTCGGTLDWDGLLLDVSSSLEALSSSPQAVGQLLGAVFGPSFLCSSSSCKSMVSELMGIVSSVAAVFGGGSAGSLGTLDAMAGVAWCPAEDAAAGYSLIQTFELSETSFNEAKEEEFKTKFVDSLNAAVTGAVYLPASSVDLVATVSGDSISVRAEVAMSQPALAAQVETEMANLAGTTPAALSTMLGVAVAAPPTAVEKAAIAALESKPESGGGGGDDETLLIVAIACGAGAVALVLALGVTCLVCACKGRSSQPAVEPAAVAGQGGKKAAATLKGNTPL